VRPVGRSACASTRGAAASTGRVAERRFGNREKKSERGDSAEGLDEGFERREGVLAEEGMIERDF